MLADSNFVLTPSTASLVLTFLGLCMLLAAVVTGLKGRWGWLAVGFLFGGTLWLFTAFLPASPDSAWARRGSGRRA